MLERLKSLGIWLALAAMVLLLYGNLTLGMTREQPETDGTLKTDSQWPVMPTLIAAGYEGRYRAVLTDRQWELQRSQVSLLLLEAVGTLTEPVPLTESELREWIAGDCLLVGYDQPVPLNALRAWSEAGALKQELRVDRILLCSREGRVLAGLRDEQDKSWYRAATAAGGPQLAAISRRLEGSEAHFAGPEGAPLAPDCLIYEQTGPLPVWQCDLPEYARSGELPRQVLSAFGMNGYLAKVYRESSGDTVYVENFRSVRITPEGELIFSASGGQGIPLEENTEAYGAARLRSLSRQVWDMLNAGGVLTLSGVTEGADSSTVYTFDLLIGGHPVSAAYGYAVSARVQDGRIRTVRMNPRILTDTGEQGYALPFSYGALLLGERENAELQICYEEKEGRLRPALCVED